jgi:GntR family transcriptional regulator, transcriptional repressor for pyruvate dehydrogenase complex
MRRVRLSEQIVDEIKRMIREEGFSDGDRFYSENELTRKLNVSRTSIREAVRMLEMAGQVKVRHGKGIFVKDASGNDFEPFAEWLKQHEITLIDHFEVRDIIDPRVAAYAAQNAKDLDIEKMRIVCNEFADTVASGRVETLIEKDREFHRLLAKSTGNKALYALITTMTTSLNEGWFSSLQIPGRPEKTVIEHRKILKAVASGNAEKAENAMKTHIENALNEIKEYLRNHQ